MYMQLPLYPKNAKSPENILNICWIIRLCCCLKYAAQTHTIVWNQMKDTRIKWLLNTPKDSRCNCVVQTQYLSFKPLSSDKSPLRFDFGLCSCDVWPRGIKSSLIRLVNPLPGVLFGVCHLLHNSKMRNMHIYQNKGQMQWILGKIYNLNNI